MQKTAIQPGRRPYNSRMAMHPRDANIQSWRIQGLLRLRKQMGANMTPHEFIEKNVGAELKKQGFSESTCFHVSRQAVDYYKQRSVFSKSALADVLAWAKKKAKELK